MKQKKFFGLSLLMFGLSLFLLIYSEHTLKYAHSILSKNSLSEVSEQDSDKNNDSLDEWELLQMAIIKTECEFNSKAVGAKEDFGIFQITPVYVEDVNRILKENVYSHSDAFDLNKSVEMFNIIQSHYNPSLNADKAVKLHNPKGHLIKYPDRVKKNMEYIASYEKIRSVVKDSSIKNHQNQDFI